MTTKKEAQESIARLRKGIKNAAPELQKDLGRVANCLESLVENAAAEMGRLGGTARAKKLSKKRRREIARAAVKAREDKRNGKRSRDVGVTESAYATEVDSVSLTGRKKESVE